MKKVLSTILVALVAVVFTGSVFAADLTKKKVTPGTAQSTEVPKNSSSKIGKLVAVKKVVGRDHSSGQLVPQMSLDASGEAAVLVEISHGKAVDAKCSASLANSLKGGERLEIKPGREAGDWIVVRVVK
jgi:hypothetical protein